MKLVYKQKQVVTSEHSLLLFWGSASVGVISKLAWPIVLQISKIDIEKFSMKTDENA